MAKQGLPVLLVLATTLAAAWVATSGGVTVMFDSFRDLACARTFLTGGLWADGMLAGESYWYPPGNPLIIAAICHLGGLEVDQVYPTSSLWWNPLIAVMLFFLVRRATDTLTGLLAVLMVGLGSLWWMTHFAAPMPSVQGVFLSLLALYLWDRGNEFLTAAEVQARMWIWWILCGICLAAAAWLHPICAMMGAAAITFHALAALLAPRWTFAHELVSPAQIRRRSIASVIIVGGTSFVLAMPLLMHFIFEVPSSRARRYTAAELFNPDFSLHLHAPLMLLLIVSGIWMVLRTRRRMLWLVGYFFAGFLAMMPAYLERLSGADLPKLLPHEFQWHAHIAAGVCAAIAVVGLGRWMAWRFSWPRDPATARLLWIGGLTVATLTPALQFVPLANSYHVHLPTLMQSRGEVVQWLRSSTDPNDVVACSRVSCYFVVAGLTGRKCVAGPLGFMNPASDVQGRTDDLSTLLTTESEELFLEVAARHRVKYLVVIPDSSQTFGLRERAQSWSSLSSVFVSGDESAVAFAIPPFGER